MTEVILKLIEYAPQIGIYVLVGLIVGFAASKLTAFYISTKRATSKFSTIEATLGRIDRGLTTLNQILLEKSVISQSCYSSENSPRATNDLGKRLFVVSGAEELYNIIKDELMAELEKKKIDSLLELERESLSIVLDKMSDPRFKNIQNFVFEHPTFEGSPLTYTDILFVMSLNLRDAYREKYPKSNLEN